MCYNIIIKVLVVATSCKKRGGITPIIKVQEMGEQWKQYPACHYRQFVKNENNLLFVTDSKLCAFNNIW